MPKITTHLWKYTNRRIKAGVSKDYYCASIPPKYYNEFLNKELLITQAGSNLIMTISGCEPIKTTQE